MSNEYVPKYEDWTEQDYLNDEHIRYCVPMTAHALEDEAEQDLKLNDPQNIVEEKFDGTRAILQFMSYGCRVFSRRISKKTNWFTENSDSLPQMRDLIIPELAGTIIDGEMFIPDRPFKDVSATMNCKWDKAIERQKELGEVVLHTFDILYYKGMCIERLSLRRRKKFLSKVTAILKKHGVTCIVEVPYFECGSPIQIEHNEPYDTGFQSFSNARKYYEHIVSRGGEGVIIKDLNAPYEHKRSKGFLKIKKFYTRECILTGFTEPTKYYDGKFPDDRWDYWEDENGRNKHLPSTSAKYLIEHGYKPLTKFYYNNWVGNMQFGVIITPEEINNLPASLKSYNFSYITLDGKSQAILNVGECSGFDDELREKMSNNSEFKRLHVIEVKCNEVFKDTGKLRHPRFLRFRQDKDLRECTYANHITE